MTHGGIGSDSWRDRVKRHEGRIALALLVLITVPMLTKIFTSDFGTHLAMGREIVRRMAIPDQEFLNYPSLGMRNTNGEWGFQVVLYLVYSAAGVYGVSLLCWAVVFGIFFLIHRATVLRGADPLVALLAIFTFSGFLRIRIQPRPEIFTYLFIALTIYLFSEYYFGRRKRLVYLFPPMVLVWANMHPTYLMAFLLCGAFFADGLAREAWKGRFRWESLRSWVVPPVAVGITGVLVCGLNPNGYAAILTPLHLISRGGPGGGDAVLMSISELTPVKGTGMLWYYKAAAVFAGCSLLVGLFGRRVYLLDLFLFAIAFKGAWDSARAVSMMGLFLSPGASLHWTGFLGRFVQDASGNKVGKNSGPVPKEKGKSRQKRREKRAGGAEGPAPRKGAVRPQGSIPPSLRAAVVLGAVCALLAFGGTTLSFSFSQLQYGIGLTEHKFSLAAAEFLRKNPIPGKMFNFFDVGGFLDWQMYPQALTFIDGRTYNQQVFQEHQMVTGAMPGWETILEKYGVTYIVTKTMDSSGMILPFISPLTNGNDWSLVFADGLFVIFVRNTPETRDYIARHRISKSMIPRQIIQEADHYIYLGVSPFQSFQIMSSMYSILGDRQAAIASLRKALEYSDDPLLRERLMQLEGGGTPQRDPGR